MDNLTFEPETHTYKLNGIKIPSVTKVLSEAGLSDVSKIPQAVLEASSNFGKVVHKTIELYCLKKLDINSVDVAIVPYLEGWKNFVEDFGYKFKRTEIIFSHPTYRYCGMIDQEGEITKGKYIGECIGDVKSGVPQPSHKYQLNGGYKLALPKRNTFLLYLNPDFKPRGYKIVFGENNKQDQNVFLCCLTLFNVREKEGLRK